MFDASLLNVYDGALIYVILSLFLLFLLVNILFILHKIPVPHPSLLLLFPLPHSTSHPLLRDIKASPGKTAMTFLSSHLSRIKVLSPMSRLSKVYVHRTLQSQFMS